MNRVDPRIEEDEPVGLGIALASIQVAVFYAFIGYCAFATYPESRGLGQGIPMPFVLGLLVVLCGAVLTVLYVLVSNGRERGHD
ncbi:hypothetical protein PS900_03588 [Pseudomonas fluorescens]|jgi:uncharacterized membrane protein (DUF485 family)|uniref:DUF485 domain-containing protein n=1 Tax=Pseudomonas fluorescens TaxID=294 RepID=A0A8H2RS63_PSEFL|nr:hypothetical protein [Pseudomonas fluorescens]VVP15844.1 hypothetical protein PS900_03588 [Pseudomonas fluorescens]